MIQKVYISLPITGRDIEEVEAECIFAKGILQKKGFIPVSPLDVSCNHDAPYSEHMGKDITALLECDIGGKTKSTTPYTMNNTT